MEKTNQNNLKIVFFGTPEFAVASLDALVTADFNVCTVVTMPDKAAGRGQKTVFSPVKQYALEHNLPLLQPEKLKDESFIHALRSLKADLFIVIAFRMLPEIVWAMPPLGTFNLHASLLPRYRGAAPINRAVLNGDRQTGVTTFFLKHEIDTGDIISREAIEIGPNENVGSVHDRLMELGAKLTVDTVRHIIAGDLKPIPQELFPESESPTPAPKIFKEDCLIDWSRSSEEIHNHIRGLSPYPAAWTHFGSDENTTTVKILETGLSDLKENFEAGQLAMIGKKVFVGTGQGTLELLRLQPAGKRPMNAADWVRGLRSFSEGQKIFFV